MSRLFGKIFKRERPRVYLGTIAVAPRVDLKRKFDEWGVFEHADLDSSLRSNLAGIFTLPLASENIEPSDNDFGLDVIVPRFQSGDAWNLELGEISFPIFWRPKIQISSRLYSLKTNKTKLTFSVTKKLSWRKFFGRVFSLRGFFRFRPMFDSHDMEHLLYLGCEELLVKMQKAL